MAGSEPAESDFGLVLDLEFHRSNRWVSAYARYLADAVIEEFAPRIVSSQDAYEREKRRLKRILCFEPGWAAPRIAFDRRVECVKAVMYSDPHYKPEERRRYFDENGFDYVLSLYKRPFLRHFRGFPEEKFVHFPWAVPDRFVGEGGIAVRSDEVAIFGAKGGEAYDVRNWCRAQGGVTDYDLSGVENKVLSDEGYYRWLAGRDAIVAAGSSNPDYDLVTPKYFEIPAAGALLFGQRCEDLPELGFDDTNMVAFTREDFTAKLAAYRERPAEYLGIRRNGRELIRRRHKLSDRLAAVRALLHG